MISQETYPTSLRSGALLAFLTLLNVLNFADRFLIQGFAVDMISDLQLTNTQFTLLTGFVFTGFYTVMGLFMGALADRMHRPRLMAIGVFLWSALTAATGCARNFAQLALVRMFTGVGEASLTPAALGMLGDVFKRNNLAFASGFYYIGAPLGIGSAFLIAGTIGASIGWRTCFYLLGAIGVVLSLVLLLLRDPRVKIASNKTQEDKSQSGSLGEIMRILKASPALCLVILGAVCVIFAQGTFVLDQLWLVQERGFAKAHAQNLSGVMFLAGGILGSVLGGIASDFMQARISGGRLYFLALIYTVGLPVGFIYRLVDPSGPFFIPCMFIGSVMLTIGYGAMFAAVQEMVPSQMRSTMTALLILCMTLLGTSPGNLAVGWWVDFYRAHGDLQAITHAVLAGTCVWLLAIPCFYAAGNLYRRGAQQEAKVAL